MFFVCFACSVVFFSFFFVFLLASLHFSFSSVDGKLDSMLLLLLFSYGFIRCYLFYIIFFGFSSWFFLCSFFLSFYHLWNFFANFFSISLSLLISLAPMLVVAYKIVLWFCDSVPKGKTILKRKHVFIFVSLYVAVGLSLNYGNLIFCLHTQSSLTITPEYKLHALGWNWCGNIQLDKHFVSLWLLLLLLLNVEAIRSMKPLHIYEEKCLAFQENSNIWYL